MLSYLLIALGGALGSVARFTVSGFVARHVGETFPWGTLLVNVSGSFVIGFFATFTGPEGRCLVPPAFRQFFMLGLCGGYTTFSSFSLQSLSLAQEGEWFSLGFKAVLSVALCLLSAWLGSLLASSRLHTSKILRLFMDLPIVIEIVDSEGKISGFLPTLDSMMGGGMVTLEKVKCIENRGTARPE